MKGYPQPLSEAFFNGSPERPVAGSFRWVKRTATRSRAQASQPQEVPHAGKDKH